MLTEQTRNTLSIAYHSVRARFFLVTNQSAKAIQPLKELVSLTKDPDKWLFLLAKTYGDLGLWKKSLETYYGAIAQQPDNDKYRMRLAILLFSRGQFAESASHFQTVFENLEKNHIDGALAHCSALLGRCHLAFDNVEKAEEYLQIAAKIAPWELDYCRGRVDLLRLTDRFDQVSLFLQECIKNYRGVYPLYLWMGDHLQYYLYQPVDALEWYQKARSYIYDKRMRRFSDEFVSSYFAADELNESYLNALISCGRESDALSFVKGRHSKIVGMGTDHRKYLIRFFMITKDYKEAERIAMEAVGNFNQNPVYWSLLSEAQVQQGKLEEALQNVNHALAIDADSISSLDVLGTIQKQQAKWNLAIETYNKIVKLSPLSANWIDDLAYCHMMLRQFEVAKALYERVIRLDPLNALTWINLGSVHLELGQPEKARSAYENVVSLDHAEQKIKETAIQKLQFIGSAT